ncbi:Ig-like domain repeat protein [Cellulomonas sp. KRMCY2]|uniref:Ig-like domain repeat protein n=1 Tax=Cellulomonas sp. KRMCY2 TaxID=1304865 RepID=UPI00045EBC58|nr:Ig-like domain repeat protein [Cellulomonas sp. KRMCY2]
MTLKKTLAGLLATSVVMGAALVAVAGPAAANDEGTELPGAIYWFDNFNPLALQSAATQISSGANAQTGGPLANGRPWATLTTENACPAGTTNMQSIIRIPQVGVAENNWVQVPVGATAVAQDADGRFYTTTANQADRLSKSEVTSYNLANGGTGTYPFISVCRDIAGASLGYFRTAITISGTTAADLTWSIPLSALPQEASTTTLAASAPTIEFGSSVDLTATVTPSAATGSVEFFAGATSLGTAVVASGVATLSTSALPVGTSSVTAQYLGGSNAASTSAAVSIEVTPVAARSTVTTLAVTPLTGDANSTVTFTSTVTASIGAPNGTVTFKDGAAVLGSVIVAGGVVPSFSTNVLGAGVHSLVAEFVGTGPYSASSSAAVEATYTQAGAVPDEQTVTVDIPVGTITITTPYTPAAPLALGIATLDPADSTFSASKPFNEIVITDSRAGNLGFTASVISGDFKKSPTAAVEGVDKFGGLYAGLTGLTAVQLPGNALLATNVSVSDHVPFVDGLGTKKPFASYPAGAAYPNGSVRLDGTFGVDQIPSSVQPGLYTATVTFTAV